MPQSFGDALARLFFRAINRQIAMHLDRLPRQYAVLLSLVNQFDGFFDGYPSRHVLAQQFADRFYRFGVCFYRQF